MNKTKKKQYNKNILQYIISNESISKSILIELLFINRIFNYLSRRKAYYA